MAFQFHFYQFTQAIDPLTFHPALCKTLQSNDGLQVRKKSPLFRYRISTSAVALISYKILFAVRVTWVVVVL